MREGASHGSPCFLRAAELTAVRANWANGGEHKTQREADFVFQRTAADVHERSFDGLTNR